MNSNDLFDIIGETPERYVLDAANAKMISMQNQSPRKLYLIAAIVALISSGKPRNGMCWMQPMSIPK